MAETLRAVWEFDIPLIPVLLTLFLFDLPALMRRATRRYYLPIYFMFFPLAYSDRMYAEYFKEDDFYGVGQDLSPRQRAALRTRIVAVSIVSMVLAALVAPILCGLIAATYLDEQTFRKFVICLLIYKSATLIRSLSNLRYVSFLQSARSKIGVIIIYALYLVLIYQGVTIAFGWASPRIDAHGIVGASFLFLEHFYLEFFVKTAVVAGVTWAVTVIFTNAHAQPDDTE